MESLRSKIDRIAWTNAKHEKFAYKIVEFNSTRSIKQIQWTSSDYLFLYSRSCFQYNLSQLQWFSQAECRKFFSNHHLISLWHVLSSIHRLNVWTKLFDAIKNSYQIIHIPYPNYYKIGGEIQHFMYLVCILQKYFSKSINLNEKTSI